MSFGDFIEEVMLEKKHNYHHMCPSPIYLYPLTLKWARRACTIRSIIGPIRGDS